MSRLLFSSASSAISTGLFAAAIAIALTAAGPVSAATKYCSNPGTWNATNTNWGTSSGGPYNTTFNSGDDAVFEGTAGTVTVSSPNNPNSITFNVSGYTLSGGTITFNANPFTITIGSTNSATISSVLADFGLGLAKAGTGKLMLSGANTYTGATTINAGMLQITGGSIAASSGVTLANASGVVFSLNVDADVTIASLSGGGANGGVVERDWNTTRALIINGSASTTFSGIIQNAGAGGGILALTQSGSGTLTLSPPGAGNTFTGGVTINNGEIVCGNAGALNSSSPNKLIFGSNTNTKTLTLNGNNITVLDLQTGSTVGAPIVQNKNSTPATLTDNTDNNYTYAGVLNDGAGGGALSLTKGSGNYTLTLSGASANTGTMTINSGTIQMGANNALSSLSKVALAGGTLDIYGTTQAIAGLTASSGYITNGTGNGTLTVSFDGRTDTCTATVGNSSALTLVKAGAAGTGILVLSNFNPSSSGLLNITNGTCRVLASSNSPPVTVSGASSFLDVGGNIGIGALTLDSGGGVTVSSGTPHFYLGGAANCINVTNPPAGGSTISLNGGILDLWNTAAYMTVARGTGANDLTITNYQYIYNNSNPWSKAGPGVLLLNNPSASQQWNNSLNIIGGTVKCGNNNALDINQVVYMADGTTLDLNGQSPTCGNLADYGTVTGTAVVTSSASGTMTLTIHQNFFGHLQRRDPERQRHDVEFHQGLQQ